VRTVSLPGTRSWIFASNRAVVDERSARRVDEVAEGVEVAGAQLADLASPAGYRALMALGAALRVVDGAEPFVDAVALLERGAERIEVRLIDEPVGEVVESRRRFGCALSLNGKRERAGKSGGRDHEQEPHYSLRTRHGALLLSKVVRVSRRSGGAVCRSSGPVADRLVGTRRRSFWWNANA